MYFSDVICQIVDARNPLLYKCDDLVNIFTYLFHKCDNLANTCSRICLVNVITWFFLLINVDVNTDPRGFFTLEIVYDSKCGDTER